MNVALYNVTTASATGGVETAVWELAKSFTNADHVGTVISGRGSRNRRMSRSVHLFPFLSRKLVPFAGNSIVGKGIERISFLLFCTPHLIRNKYDIFIVFKPMDFFALALVKLFHPGTKTIFFSQGFDFYKVDRLLVRFADEICAVSSDNAQTISKRYARHVAVIPNGVDVEKFIPLPDRVALRDQYFPASDGNVMFMSVGRLVGWKGHAVSVRALALLPAEFIYVVVGDGPERKSLEILASDLDIAHRIIFMGDVSNDMVVRLLNCADIYVQPSIGNEALGIALLEALSVGVPVVASRNGGMPDIVKVGFNGLLFETGDANACAKAITQVASVRANMVPRCRPYVENNFSWRASTQKILTLASKEDCVFPLPGA